MRGAVVGIRFLGVGVGECQSEDSVVCFGAKPTRRAYERDFLKDRKKTRKGKVPGQSTDSSQRQSGDGKATVRERRVLKGLGIVDQEARSASARG